MGSLIEINDTLQLTKAQGFPKQLDFSRHNKKPFRAGQFKAKQFQFKNKPRIRVYQQPPVRNFLVQNIRGKWLYWGWVHIFSIEHNYKKQVTSGSFEIVKIYNPAQMRQVFDLLDGRPEFNYFK